MTTRPTVGITVDLDKARCTLRENYVSAVLQAGGLPLLLPPIAAGALAEDILDKLDAIVFSGGDDPHMDALGHPQHQACTLVARARQDAELALMAAVLDRPQLPLLGVCLGMQWMGILRGATLDQHLPDHLPTHADHEDDREHLVKGSLGSGLVTSRHHQALASAGQLQALAYAPDGVLEAVGVPGANFQVGVQWHPERTRDEALGQGLFDRLIEAARTA